MIPHVVRIKNFLSYGPELQTIDFTPHHLLCFSGKNGHGKSALLDTITWAIWGQARKSTGVLKADEGLIHLGQRTMLVIFDFECNNRLYRIKREFTLSTTGKGTVTLDFGIIDPETQCVYTQTEKTVRDTQTKIERAIGIDYESFINSAFLRQNHSNEFCQKSPLERKEVLARILGLTPYEQLRKAANDTIKKLSGELAHAQLSLTILAQELSRTTELAQKEQQLVRDAHTCTLEKQALATRELDHATATIAYTEYCVARDQQAITTQNLISRITQWRRINHAYSRQNNPEIMRIYTELSEKITWYSSRVPIFEHYQSAQQELSRHTPTVAQLPTIINQITILEKKIERARAYYHRWITTGNAGVAQSQDITRKHAMINHDNNPCCPLCEQNISAGRRTFLAHIFTAQLRVLAHQKKRLEKILPTLKEQLINDTATLKQLYTARTEAQSAVATCNLLQEKITQYKIALAGIDLSKNISHEYRILQQEREKLNYTPTAITPDQHSTQEIYDQLRAARAQARLLLNHYKNLKYTSEHDRLTEQRAISELRTLLDTKIATIARDQGILAHEQELLKKRTHEHTQLSEKITKLTHDSADYQAIYNACSKDGIPALLIEEALPDIEQEANRLLARLTDNQSSVHFESLRDLKKGGTRETLEIKISDGVGMRPYEMFSGGEAFRIDFAVRIAIAKLLAQRAGTALQTLIIDEGFGSQDDEGLHHVMEALHSIQEDFAKIIIVSHLPAMKDQFPVQFLIEKSSKGSSVRVFEQG